MALTRRQRVVANIRQQAKVYQVKLMRETAEFLQWQYRNGRTGAYLDDLTCEDYDFLITKIHKIVHLLGIEADITMHKPFIRVEFKE